MTTLLPLLFALFTAAAAPPTPPAPPPPPGEDGYAADEDDDFGGGGHDDGDRLARHFPEVAERLGLSADQKKKVEDLFYASHQARIDIKARKAKAALEVKRLMGAEKLDEKALAKAIDTLIAAEGDLRRNQMGLLIEIRKVLTPAQWEQLAAMREEGRAARKGERRPPPR